MPQHALFRVSSAPHVVSAKQDADRPAHEQGRGVSEQSVGQREQPSGQRERRRKPVDDGHDAAHRVSIAYGRRG